MIKKGISLGIIFLFIGASIPVFAYSDDKTSSSLSNGNWLYVGGGGPGNYSKIQDAINDSSDGDTVFVFDDISPYNERIFVRKQIRLLGEIRNTTIIQRGILVTADYVTISDFTICNGFSIIDQNNILLSGNILTDRAGFCGCTNVNFSYNSIYGIGGPANNALFIDDCSQVAVIGNMFYPHPIYGNAFNFVIQSSKHVLIFGNSFFDACGGLACGNCINMSITLNSFFNLEEGIYITGCLRTNIFENNFNATSDCHWFCGFGNRWDKNYWGEPRTLPKPIHFVIPFVYFIHWYEASFIVKLDWHPAKEPYDIPGMR